MKSHIFIIIQVFLLGMKIFSVHLYNTKLEILNFYSSCMTTRMSNNNDPI